jgi:hypothetical protein
MVHTKGVRDEREILIAFTLSPAGGGIFNLILSHRGRGSLIFTLSPAAGGGSP